MVKRDLFGTVLLALCAGWFAPLVAQNPHDLEVVPANATMLVGESRTFRAVGRDGRIRHDVRWSVSPPFAVELTVEGDEVTVVANGRAGTVVLSASADRLTSEATIEIRSGDKLSPGSVIWSVQPIPGCKVQKIIQAVPTANGPDIYVQEECPPNGTVIRALTADGRELWRRGFGTAQEAVIPGLKTGEPVSVKPLNIGQSVCDAVAIGMAKDAVSKALREYGLHLDEREKQSAHWGINERGVSCDISFDTAGTVSKKKKVITTD